MGDEFQFVMVEMCYVLVYNQWFLNVVYWLQVLFSKLFVINFYYLKYVEYEYNY